jgi:hypothetical protein
MLGARVKIPVMLGLDGVIITVDHVLVRIGETWIQRIFTVSTVSIPVCRG